MLKLLQEKLTGSMLALCMLIMSFMPSSHVYAENDFLWGETTWILLGTAALGAGVGAAVGASQSRGGHHHSHFFSNPSQLIDVGQTLDFQIVMEDLKFGTNDTFFATPYITLPDGKVLQGVATQLEDFSLQSQFIINLPNIQNPQIGKYIIGVLITGGPDLALGAFNLYVRADFSNSTAIFSSPQIIVMNDPLIGSPEYTITSGFEYFAEFTYQPNEY